MFRSLTSRLTLWHTAIFAALSLVLFGLVSLALRTNLRARTDEELENESREFEDLYRRNGIEALRSEFRLEGESEGFKRIFFRFFSSGGEQLLASDMSAWGGLGAPPPAAATLAPGRSLIAASALPGRPHGARMIYRKTGDGGLIQIGITTEDDDHLLAGIRRVFGAAIAVMLFFSGVAGYFIARKAMRGVTRVTDAAVRIGQGDLARRVPPAREGLEIDSLSRAFNNMLERIQALVEEVTGVTDNIAHDLRSPITRIRGIAETTLTGAQRVDDYRQMAGIVIEECDRMVHMINTMLEIAQADSGVAVFARAPVDLGRFAADACDLFHPAAEDRKIRLTIDGAGDPVLALGDGTRLQRVIANLLDNAVKFTAPGGEIVLSVRATPAHALLSLRDSGVGIDRGDISRIFDRFYRGDRSRSTPGNGLGLSFALAIVRAHGGDITVESSPGKGSTFTVRLPRIPHRI
jgi:heavy metal sensor kinase